MFDDDKTVGYDTIIFDIDGTLADLGHRRHHVASGKTQWGAFFDEMVNDPPLRDVTLLAELLGDHPLVNQGAIKLFLFSGRPETHRKETEAWLLTYARSYFQKAEGLLMRAAGDYRSDVIVKREFLAQIKKDGYNPRFVVDDRPGVCDMWVEEGVTCLQHINHLDEWDTKRTWELGDLVMMVGPSGAGKSTYVKERWPEHHVVSSDLLREQITGDFADQSANTQMWSLLHGLVKARIEGGMLTVVDVTNLRARDRRALRDLVPKDTRIFYHVVDRPLNEKLASAGWRKDVMIKGKSLVHAHHESFKSGVKLILAGDNDPRVNVITEGRKV